MTEEEIWYIPILVHYEKKKILTPEQIIKIKEYQTRDIRIYISVILIILFVFIIIILR